MTTLRKLGKQLDESRIRSSYHASQPLTLYQQFYICIYTIDSHSSWKQRPHNRPYLLSYSGEISIKFRFH